MFAVRTFGVKLQIRKCLTIHKHRHYSVCESGGPVSSKLFAPFNDKSESTSAKVTIVGSGQVGMAAAISLLTKRVTDNLVLLDSSAEKVKGEMLDLQHGSIFLNSPKIQASSDYGVTDGSKVVIVTAGVRQKPGETRLVLTQRNVDIMKEIIPKIVKHSPDSIMVLATNPVDILSYVTWKLSGFPKHRVMGSGCVLDSARLRFLMAEKYGIASNSCHGYVIGEHGDSSVAVWSGMNVAGTRIKELNPDVGKDSDPEKWKAVHTRVVKSGYEVIQAKGYTSWAIGLSLCEITAAILNNENSIHAVSTYLKGQHGVESEVFLSLPCVLGHGGVSDVVHLSLTDEERRLLQKSASIIHEMQSTVEF